MGNWDLLMDLSKKRMHLGFVNDSKNFVEFFFNPFRTQCTMLKGFISE